MISFREFLQEKLVACVNSTAFDDDFVDVFLNPTAAELSGIPTGYPYPTKQLGAWASSSAVYIWDRNQLTHVGARTAVDKSTGQLGVALYIELNPVRVDPTATVSIAKYSYSGTADPAQLTAFLKRVPAFKTYRLILDL